jgi:hypothetical protein
MRYCLRAHQLLTEVAPSTGPANGTRLLPYSHLPCLSFSSPCSGAAGRPDMRARCKAARWGVCAARGIGAASRGGSSGWAGRGSEAGRRVRRCDGSVARAKRISCAARRYRERHTLFAVRPAHRVQAYPLTELADTLRSLIPNIISPLLASRDARCAYMRFRSRRCSAYLYVELYLHFAHSMALHNDSFSVRFALLRSGRL